ncbi:MAG: hypothetical protein ACE15B_19075 [Bryobacteraceae bacterium]
MPAKIAARIILLSGTLILTQLWGDGGASHQKRNPHFGVSGGNVNDISKLYCCSGTLGALVVAGGTPYILSNNHVLARSDQAAVGEDISQPGMIDSGCRPADLVADFSVAPKLGSNVDAALALLRPGTMDATGFIEDIGVPAATVRLPAIGLPVAKSGRTTGFTTGTISSINTSVRVTYQKGCGTGKKFTVSYRNQVVIGGSGFSAGGDSGSLIVTNDAAHQPVALLFAGSSTSTIGNPMDEVLTKLSGALGVPVALQGSAAVSAIVPAGPSQALVAQATEAVKQHEQGWMAHGNVAGVGVGAADENPNEAVIVVYIDRNQGNVPDLPDQARGFRVKRVPVEPFAALGCCASCR